MNYSRVVMGIIKSYLGNLSQERLIEYIRENKNIELPVEKLAPYRAMIRKIRVEDITEDEVFRFLLEHRGDIAGIIVNQPGGKAWFSNQFQVLKIAILNLQQT